MSNDLELNAQRHRLGKVAIRSTTLVASSKGSFVDRFHWKQSLSTQKDNYSLGLHRNVPIRIHSYNTLGTFILRIIECEAYFIESRFAF